MHTLRFLRAHPVASQRLVAAVGRYLRWQLAIRLMPGAFVLPWVDGARLVARKGQTGATGNWYAGLMEYQDMGFILHFLRPGDLFLDVGANVGAFTVLAARVVGADVIAVEPGPRTRRYLAENILMNDISERVTIEPRGIGRSPGMAHFTMGRDTVDQITRSAGADTFELEITTIDAVTQARRPTCIKIDIEGGEFDAIAGAETTLADPSLAAVIVELNDNAIQAGHSIADITDRIARHGFQGFGYDPRRRALTDRPLPDSDNQIFVRDRAMVEHRLRAAASVDIFGTRL